MSDARLCSAVDQLRESAITTVWRQWQALGAMASASRRANGIVDPEALLLLSFVLEPHHARLADEVRWCAGAGARVTSVQRLKNLLVRFPTHERVRQGVSRFADAAGAMQV